MLRLLVGGKRNREIASNLDITEGTVEARVSSILGKLAVADRTEAVTVALQRGIVQLGAGDIGIRTENVAQLRVIVIRIGSDPRDHGSASDISSTYSATPLQPLPPRN
jgi:hypothetical protein